MRYQALLLFLSTTYAFQLPFNIPKIFSSSVPSIQAEQSPVSSTPRIAIIGAGAGGSSAAYWISKAKERFGLDAEIDVYESNDYIGGRSTVVYPYDNTSLPEFELGASIFVEANKNLWRASDEFNLTRRDFHELDSETGIWDGEKMLLSFSGGWWDTAKLLWRYGFLSPKRTESFVRNMINQILVLYSLETPTWDSIHALSEYLGWTDMVNSTTLGHLSSLGISTKCLLYGTGATGIAGGNFQLFEKFLNSSKANVYLNTHPSSPQLWSVKSSRGTLDYKAVILAAPFHSTDILFPLSVSDQVPEVPYVHLHVTLLATTSPTLNPAYFGLPSSSSVPHMLLTTNQGTREGRTKPEFNSISYHGLVRDNEWGVKIFSDHEISDEWLNTMFNGHVGWVVRKWNSYPKLPPTFKFPPVKLDRGLYYVNSFEPFISTMETETISSRNVVDLMLNDEFNASICGRSVSAVDSKGEQPVEKLPTALEESAKKDFVFGWDC
ncbi:hypothetical protein CPB84DRAFT_1841381 [Gymnopilus junonius]|uniref:Prenylcysteine lyase domain-containing protein n=1 Tax=Gymnopilus junonius TaxID=109634 RepID=A0A9P5NYG8_GYMJU|nr:hypothetical protein CPB84DRAFT_1841381 [Gymnopilus junonius]